MDLQNFLSRHDHANIASEFGISRITVWRGLTGIRNNKIAHKVRNKAAEIIDSRLEEWKKNRELFINEGRLPSDN